MVATGKYQVITREEIDQLLANQRIQVSSISSRENVQKLQLQNISYIVTGSVDAMGNDYAVTMKILDVSTGRFSHSANDFIGGSPRDLYTGITALTGRFVAGMSSRGGQVVQTSPAQNQPANTQTREAVYKIGDIGPAGGIVFYDQCVFSYGWRYLEAVPAGMERKAEWGAYERVDGSYRGIAVSGTKTAVGGGKRNTQLIVELLRKQGETNRAAQICAALEVNGFKDWFLPSKDELDLMYKNLAAKGLGGFSGGWYWSSSEYGRYSWFQRFSDGLQGSSAKYYTGSVRAVRAF
jgi:hypothetical protein